MNLGQVICPDATVGPDFATIGKWDGLRWWIEHKPVQMCQYADLKQTDRHMHRDTANTIIGRTLSVFEDDDWRSMEDVAAVIKVNVGSVLDALNTLTRRDQLVRIGKARNYRFRRTI